MTDLTVEDYSEKAIVVRGDTKPYKEQLKALGGKFNAALKVGGPGWIFTKRSEDKVQAFVASGVLDDGQETPKPVLKPVANPTTRPVAKPLVDSSMSSGLIRQVEEHVSTLPVRERLLCLGMLAEMSAKIIACLANDKVPSVQPKALVQVKPVAKPVSKSFAKPALAVTDDEEEDEEASVDEEPPKRLLVRK